MVEQVYINFGKKVKFYREQKELSQEELALSIDVDKSYIGRIERGQRNPSLKVICNIAQELGVSIKTLFDF